MHSVERRVALPAARRRHLCVCALRVCTASSGAWLCPPLDVGTFVHAPVAAHAQWARAAPATSTAWHVGTTPAIEQDVYMLLRCYG
eukprot:1359550-Pleurochrysis_carterae.AAC.1